MSHKKRFLTGCFELKTFYSITQQDFNRILNTVYAKNNFKKNA